MLTPSAIGGLLSEDLLHKKTAKNMVHYIARNSSCGAGQLSYLAICG